jgi:hypothetical protein
VTAPFREQDVPGLSARRFRIAVEVEILEQLVCLRLRALVVLPVVLPRIAIELLVEFLERERRFAQNPVVVLLPLEPVAARTQMLPPGRRRRSGPLIRPKADPVLGGPGAGALIKALVEIERLLALLGLQERRRRSRQL